MPNLSSWGVVIGRFQTPDLTIGHVDLFNAVYSKHNNMIVLVGQRPAYANIANPLPFMVIHDMIKAMYPEAVVLPLTDTRENGHWEIGVDTLIGTTIGLAPATLYVGRTSGIVGAYAGRYPLVQLDLPNPMVSATAMRDLTEPIPSSDFRSGMVYAAKLAAPRMDIAVDMAVFREASDHRDVEVILVRKPRETKLRFPGGMFDIGKDEGFVFTAGREMYEETGVTVERSTWKYLGDFDVNDWRTRGTDAHVYRTLFYTAMLPWSSPVEAGDDIKGGWAGYVDPHTIDMETDIVEEHHMLWEALMNTL